MVARVKSEIYKVCYLVTDEPLIFGAIEQVIRKRKESITTSKRYGVIECGMIQKGDIYEIWKKEDAPNGATPCMLVIKDR